jgi:Asp-tRNA(Asn)/Glu-tRNA(Gln) amidotransferase A subunit family amidase
MSIDRRAFLEACTAAGLAGLLPGAIYAQVASDEQAITAEHIAAAEVVAGLSFTPQERAMMVEDVNHLLDDYDALRAMEMPNAQAPATIFDPCVGGATLPDPVGARDGVQWVPPPAVSVPTGDDLAYASVATLAAHLRVQNITSVELTTFFLERLREVDGVLKAVITYTEARAMEAARRADEEIANGGWRGPLHGIPYGAKDLLAVEGFPTTWGAEPYRDQTLDATAAVIRRLDAAGAVLIAKLSLGALAWGDVWYGGTTRNPWNLDQGSSGSSAGPGAAVAAGAVPFAIGSETLGSIVSPSTRTGVTGHRPTFGAVPRTGAMTLSWTMDKLGPMARSALDCALVYDTIRGADPGDPASRDVPFTLDPSTEVAGQRVGFVERAFEGSYDNAAADAATLDVLRDLGLDLQPVTLPDDRPVGAILNTLKVEAAAAFDALTRSDRDARMVRQSADAWPHVFRTARMVPAVEHVQMDRARAELATAMHAALDGLDAFVSPSFRGGTLRITNLTGHPCVCVPNAFRPVDERARGRRQPGSITFVGALYRDDVALAVAHAYQQATDFHRRRPPLR